MSTLPSNTNYVTGGYRRIQMIAFVAGSGPLTRVVHSQRYVSIQCSRIRAALRAKTKKGPKRKCIGRMQ